MNQPASPSLFQFVLYMADNCLVLGHRLGEWCGHGPVLEQDIAAGCATHAMLVAAHALGVGDDWALLPGALNDTWQWVEKDLTLVTVPGAGHFVQQDAADAVSRTILAWLNR